MRRPHKIISGGQTGVDRAALDVALELGIPCGGFCPRGRRAEDGRIPDRYPLDETESSDYLARTASNVRLADATLLLVRRRADIKGGTLRALSYAIDARQPVLALHMDEESPDARAFQRWLDLQAVDVLNVAGPRESRARGIEVQARDYLRALLAPVAGVVVTEDDGETE